MSPFSRSCNLALAAALLLLCAAAAQAASPPKPASGCAKYRYQSLQVLVDEADVEAYMRDRAKWLKTDCPMATGWGEGFTISTDPAVYAVAALGSKNTLADVAHYIDFKSLDDLKACFANGMKSGLLPAARKHAKTTTSARVVYPLTECPPASNAPATVRYLYAIQLTDNSAALCAKAERLQRKIDESLKPVRAGDGCDALGGDTKHFGPGLQPVSNYGGFKDFKSREEMTKFLSANLAARTEILPLFAAVTRTAIPLAGDPKQGRASAKAGGGQGAGRVGSKP